VDIGLKLEQNMKSDKSLMKAEEHRVTEWSRLEGTSGGCLVHTLCSSRYTVHHEPIAQDHVQADFEYLPGWRLYSLPEQPV